MSGRLGTVYGHRNVLIVGAAWFVIWSLANGFFKDFVGFNIARAMSGIGGALIMPNAVALISTAIPPGRMRNVTLGFFGASGPIGSYIGAIWAGFFIRFANFNWIFLSMYATSLRLHCYYQLTHINSAIAGICIFGPLFYLLPVDQPIDRNGKVDWIGAALGSGGLILFSVAWKWVSLRVFQKTLGANRYAVKLQQAAGIPLSRLPSFSPLFSLSGRFCYLGAKLRLVPHHAAGYMDGTVLLRFSSGFSLQLHVQRNLSLVHGCVAPLAPLRKHSAVRSRVVSFRHLCDSWHICRCVADTAHLSAMDNGHWVDVYFDCEPLAGNDAGVSELLGTGFSRDHLYGILP